MKYLQILATVSCVILTIGCDPGPQVSGHSVSYWVKRLDDLDPKTQWDALQKLYFVAPKDLEFARKKLHGLAIGDSQIAGQANALLAEKFPKQ